MRRNIVKYKFLWMLHCGMFSITLECKISHTHDMVAYVLLKGRECVPLHKQASYQVGHCSISVFIPAFQMGTRKLERKCNDIAAVNYSFLACIQLLNTHFFQIFEFRCLYCSLEHMVLRNISFKTFKNQRRGAA